MLSFFTFFLLLQLIKGTPSDKAPATKVKPDKEDNPDPFNAFNSLIDPEEPPVVTPDEKESHKVPATLNESGDKQLYSSQVQEYFNFHKQMYAPEEQDYLKFLKDLELKSDPAAEQKGFAEWLDSMDANEEDLQPIPPQTSPHIPVRQKAPPKRRVAFSKETTVRFFSRTREELLQLRKRYTMKRGGGGQVEDDSSDEEDWPLFKYLDDKLKEMKESEAWEDPMAAVTDMFVSKEIKEKISPMICVCEDQAASTTMQEEEVNRSLADLDDEDELEPAMAVAKSRAASSETMAADNEVSFLSQESNGSGISALWFAVPYKSPHAATPEKPAEFIIKPESLTSSAGATEKKDISASQNSTQEPPKSLSLNRESKLPQPADLTEEAAATSTVSVDPVGPKKESLSWLVEELDSRDSMIGGTPMFSADPPNESADPINDSVSSGKNTSTASLGRNTHSSLLRKVSQHLNVSVESLGTKSTSSSGRGGNDAHLADNANDISSSKTGGQSVSSLKDLFAQPVSNGESISEQTSSHSEVKRISVPVADLDDLVGPKKKGTRTPLLGRQAASASTRSLGDISESSISNDGSGSSKESAHEKRKRVVNAAKRWAASQQNKLSGSQRSLDTGKVKNCTVSKHLDTSGSISPDNPRRIRQVVSGAKRWAASQKASFTNKSDDANARSTRSAEEPLLEEAPDLDESRDWDAEPNAAHDLNTSYESSGLWEGVVSPVNLPDDSDSDDSRDDSEDHPTDEGEIVFDYAAKGDDVACVDSNPWLSSEDGPDLDEAKTWDIFARDMTATTGSVSLDNQSLEEEEWVAFPPDDIKDAPRWDEAWTATFSDATERPQAAAQITNTSPRKHVRQSGRVKKLAGMFERGEKTSPEGDWGISPSPLKPSTPWADAGRRKENVVEYPDLQQPVLDESRSGSDTSPVSVTLM